MNVPAGLLASVTVILLCLTGSAHQQSTISLSSSQWFVSNSNNSIVAPAQVPGGIYTDLRRANVLKQDILYGKNDIAYRWVGNENWTYTTSFAIDDQIARSQSVKLVLHGVDTVAKVLLNGEEIGNTESMFIRYKFDIKSHLRLAGLQNILAIKFESPIKYSARKSHQSIKQNKGKIIPPYCPSPAQRGECHINFMRKMQASFSWDWGPAFPSVGLYKDIEIEFGSFGLIRDILVETRRLPPMVPPNRETTPSPPMIISSSIRHQVRTPSINKSVPYVRAPPFYFTPTGENSIDQHQLGAAPVDPISRGDATLQAIDENWLLKVTLVAEMVQPSFGYNLRVEFSLDETLHYESEHINVVANSDGVIRLGFNLRIDPSRLKVRPWWPNNAGSQTLYRLSARMMPIPNPSERTRKADVEQADPKDTALQSRRQPPRTASTPFITFLSTNQGTTTFQLQYVSEKELTFGFRTVELIQEPINKGNLEEGLTFNLRINGVDLFAMGSNWIPASVLPEYSNDFEYIRYLLQSAKDANMNMLRVWGGGIYESDEFYKLADEMGIMIWHDLMFACALYPAEEEFLSLVRTEVEQQVQRLHHHPSVVLWAGNNENEMAIAGPWWPEILIWNKKLREAYAKLYVDTIKPIVQILDPTRPYVESSPSNGFLSQSEPYTIARTPNDNKYGDVHHYDYLADSFEWTNYPSTRFASEYGFQSYPSFNTLASATTQNDWKYPLTPNILHRQHRQTGDTEIKLQIRMHFPEVESGGLEKFKSFLYVSQLTQAIAIKTESEFYRRNRFIDPETKLGKTMGALYWQLNDVWQAPTWSSIEYGGKWKMLHYFARRFFFPIQIMPSLVNHHSSSSSHLFQQLFASGSALVPGNRQHLSQQFSNDPHVFQQQLQQYQQQTASATTGGPLFVVDLVRDDLFNLLDSFNVTIRFYRWTSFAPVWQDMVYVKNTRPQNVTRIYEQEVARIVRHPGVISLSSGVFQVIIEQQPRLGLSQIENYLMPVVPNRVTAMRVAKINVELMQGPFELTDHLGSRENRNSPAQQWSCAYRMTLVSDSIAMFVWLDLNMMNVQTLGGAGKPPVDEQQSPRPLRPPEHIHLNAAPSSAAAHVDTLPEHIRVPVDTHDRSDPAANLASSVLQHIENENRSRKGPKRAPKFKPLPGSGSDQLRYQFSDNAFNMFEPSKVIDLYLSECLTKSQVELALEIRTLADAL